MTHHVSEFLFVNNENVTAQVDPFKKVKGARETETFFKDQILV